MRKRTKRMAGLALAVMMAAGSLAACGGQKETPATAAPAAADTKETKAEESKAADTAGETAAGEALELSWYVGEPESHAWSQISYDIAKEIEEKTNGSLIIKAYPGATLGTQAEALDMLRTGSLAFEVTGPSILASFCDQVQVYSLPYAFDNVKQAYDYFASEGSQKMYNETVLNASGVRTLDVWYYGDRNLTIKGVEPMKPDDLAGLSVRCMDTPIAKTVVSALGGNPVPINMSELYLSLQTGVVVGEENPVPTIIAQKFYEVQDAVVLTKHSVHLGTVEVSEQIWQSLTEEQRQVITDVLAKYRPVIEERINKETEEGLEFLKEQGMKVIEPDIEAFKANAAKVVDENFGSDPAWAAAIKDLNDFKANWKE
ncbi:MAG: TRAP transporter substrate-binding protein [Clostridia bacterium]|nr:TRAP transporter substrate-binding protein [Clostridia bacterium]